MTPRITSDPRLQFGRPCTDPEATVIRVLDEHGIRAPTRARTIATAIVAALGSQKPTPVRDGNVLAELREIIPTLAESDLFALTNPPVVGIIQALKAPCRACGTRPAWWTGPDSETQQEAAMGVSEPITNQGGNPE